MSKVLNTTAARARLTRLVQQALQDLEDLREMQEAQGEYRRTGGKRLEEVVKALKGRR